LLIKHAENADIIGLPVSLKYCNNRNNVALEILSIFSLKVFAMENILFLQLQFNNDIMATVTINYDSKNVLIKSILRSAILAGATQVATKKMSPLDMALEDVRSGNVTTIFTPNYDREKRQYENHG